MTRLWFMLAVAGILGAWRPAYAQATASLDEASARSENVRVPRVEIGASISAILPIVSEGGPAVVLGGGPRVALNMSPRIAIELLAETFGPVEGNGIYGLYLTQVKVPFTKSQNSARTLSLTAGVAGDAAYQRFGETRRARPDGSTVVHPDYRRFRVNAPNTFCAGVSGDHVFSSNASGSWALQGFIGAIGGLAVRASVGVAFGIGGYR